MKIRKFLEGSNIFRRPDGSYFYLESPDSEEVSVTPLNTTFPNPTNWTFIDGKGKLYTPREIPLKEETLIQQGSRNPLVRWWNNYKGEALNTIPKGYHTLPAMGLAASLPAAGEAAAPLLANPYVDAGITSVFAGHGLNELLLGRANWTTALEIAPATRVLKPLVRPVFKGISEIGTRLKYSNLGDRVRGIKYKTDVYHGTRQPHDISLYQGAAHNTDTGLHVADNVETTRTFANPKFGGYLYKGTLRLKEAPFEIRDLNRWTPDNFYAEAQQNPAFKKYLEDKGFHIEDWLDSGGVYEVNEAQYLENLRRMRERYPGYTAPPPKFYLTDFYKTLQDAGVNLKYINEHEAGNGFSYYLSNPKDVQWKGVEDYGPIDMEAYNEYLLSKKQGGTLKAQQGTKLGNFLNSEAGKSLVSGLSSLANTFVLNKKVSSNADIAKSGIDMLTEELKKQSKLLRRQEGLALLLNNIDPENPNATGGVFQDYFLNLYMNLDLLSIEQAGLNLKAMIDALALLEKSDNWTSSVGSVIQNGLGTLGDYLSNKNSNKGSIYLLNDFWKNPSLYNNSNYNLFKTNYSFNTSTLKAPTYDYKTAKILGMI